MAVSKRAIYIFKTMADTGINTVPDNRLVLVEQDFALFIKKNNNGLTAGSSVQDALNGGNLNPFWSQENDGVGSNNDAGLWCGHRLINISTSEPTASDGKDTDIWFLREA